MEQLLQQCIDLLHPAVVFSHEKSRMLVDKISARIHFAVSGIDWEKHPNYLDLTPENLQAIENRTCCILWDEYTLPIIGTNLEGALKHIDAIK